MTPGGSPDTHPPVLAVPSARPRGGPGEARRDLLDLAPCGVLATTADGLVTECNRTLLDWLGLEEAELVGRLRLVDLLAPGGRLYHETHYAPMLRMHGEVREIALELVRADGLRIPVLVNASAATGPDGAVERVHVAVFQARERRRYERELLRAKEAAEAAELQARALAVTLQQTLIPPSLPRVPGLELAAVYRPAGEGTQVGGDFYDVFEVATDDWVVVLGDVCGKGVEAAVVTALVRHTLRAGALAFSSPADALDNLNEVLRHHETEKFCTVVMARLRRTATGWRARVAVGGHPPPLLLAPDAPPVATHAHGPLVGVLAEVAFDEDEVVLDPGCTLLLHTDGVTEGRRRGELYGEERMLRVLAASGPDPHAVVARLTDDVLAFQDGLARDDVAVLAVGVPAGFGSG